MYTKYIKHILMILIITVLFIALNNIVFAAHNKNKEPVLDDFIKEKLKEAEQTNFLKKDSKIGRVMEYRTKTHRLYIKANRDNNPVLRIKNLKKDKVVLKVINHNSGVFCSSDYIIYSKKNPRENTGYLYLYSFQKEKRYTLKKFKNISFMVMGRIRKGVLYFYLDSSKTEDSKTDLHAFNLKEIKSKFVSKNVTYYSALYTKDRIIYGYDYDNPEHYRLISLKYDGKDKVLLHREAAYFRIYKGKILYVARTGQGKKLYICNPEGSRKKKLSKYFAFDKILHASDREVVFTKGEKNIKYFKLSLKTGKIKSLTSDSF